MALFFTHVSGEDRGAGEERCHAWLYSSPISMGKREVLGRERREGENKVIKNKIKKELRKTKKQYFNVIGKDERKLLRSVFE
jgi:hypothetical protein